MCFTTQIFTACPLCGFASLNSLTTPPTLCPRFPACPMTTHSILHQRTGNDLCHLCALADTRRVFYPMDWEPIQRTAAPTYEVAQMRGRVVAAWGEQEALVDLVRESLVREQMEQELSLRDRFMLQLGPDAGVQQGRGETPQNAHLLTPMLPCPLLEEREAVQNSQLSFRDRLENDDFSHPGVQQALQLLREDDETAAVYYPVFQRPISLDSLFLPRMNRVDGGVSLTAAPGPLMMPSVLFELDEQDRGMLLSSTPESPTTPSELPGSDAQNGGVPLILINGKTETEAEAEAEAEWQHLFESQLQAPESVASPFTDFDDAFGREGDVATNF